MCDLLPEVENCCNCINARIAMLMMAVLAIVTGCIMLSVLEQRMPTSFTSMSNISSVGTDPKDIMKNQGQANRTGIIFSAMLYMLAGVLLLIGTLADQVAFINVFVWITFLNAMLGFVMVLSVAHQCMTRPGCVLAELDWLSAAGSLVLTTLYLGCWVYFVSVANTYALYNSI